MLGQPDARVVLVQPIDLAAALGQIEIDVPPIHLASVVVVFLDVGFEIKLGDALHDGIDRAFVREHYYLRFVFRVRILRFR